MIKGVALSQEFNNNYLFKDISLNISNGLKIGLIGRNGTGKTTLFKLLTNESKPSIGKLIIENEKIGYLKQEFDFPNDYLVGEYLEDICKIEKDIWNVEKIIGQLNLVVDYYQQIETLSGGEKMRLKLASILYNQPTTLLLDEPTNHLDIYGIAWLKGFIKKFKGTVITISHDRDLLNETSEYIFELDQKTLLKFHGNYDSYLKQKEDWVEKKELEYNRFTERKNRLEILLKKAQAGIIRSRSGNATEAAKKRIEREITKKEVKQYEKKEYKSLNILGSVHSDKLVLRAKNLYKSFEDNLVLRDITFEIRGGEKIWLFGPNGVGKTTLVKSIMGLEKIDKGELKVGENINIGYFEQKQKPMDIEDKLIEYYQKHTNYSYYQIPKILEDYLFNQDDMNKPVKLLSPGQQARLKFSLFSETSSIKNYHFLILDEPAQHLDIETKEVVERCMDNFKGAILLISHDVYSVSKINIDRAFRMEKNTFSIE